jgi:hypothetical protein
MNKASIHNEWHRRRLACDAIAHPANAGSRVQRGIASNPLASRHSQRIGARERFRDTQRKF